MKVLLIQSYLGRKEPPVYPLGLAYIATFLNNHIVRIFDPNIASDPWDMLRKELSDFSPDIIGVSLRNIDNQQRIKTFYYYKTFQKMIQFVKKCQPHIPLVVGGAGFSMFAQKIMERNAMLDFGVHLEGEESFPELLSSLEKPEKVRGIFYRKNGDVHFTGPRGLPDFGNFPMPIKNLIDITKYLTDMETIGTQTKRGCPLKCSYCNYPFLNGNTVRIRSPKNVVDEIESLMQLGVDRLMFADGVFNIPLSNAINICNEIIRRGIKIKWSAWLDLNHATEEFLVQAKKAGCISVTFSPDAISKNALKEIRKGFTEADIHKNLELFINNKELKELKVSYHLFVNPPGETFLGFIKTILFYLKTKFLLKGRGGAFLGWIRIEPETRVYETALREKLLCPDTDLLPENKEELSRLFYSKPYIRSFDFIVISLLKIVDSIKRLLLWKNTIKTT